MADAGIAAFNPRLSHYSESLELDMNKQVFKKFLQFFLFCFLSLVWNQLQARELTAKKNGVKVYAESSKKSEVIAKLKKGDVLSEQGRKGMYWNVKLENGKEGFVSVLKVKRKKGKGSSEFASALRKAVQQGRSQGDASNVRSRSAVMGVRGLDESEDTAFAGNVKPNPRLVLNLENYTVDQEKIENIGKLVEQEIESKMSKRK